MLDIKPRHRPIPRGIISESCYDSADKLIRADSNHFERDVYDKGSTGSSTASSIRSSPQIQASSDAVRYDKSLFDLDGELLSEAEPYPRSTFLQRPSPRKVIPPASSTKYEVLRHEAEEQQPPVLQSCNGSSYRMRREKTHHSHRYPSPEPLATIQDVSFTESPTSRPHHAARRAGKAFTHIADEGYRQNIMNTYKDRHARSAAKVVPQKNNARSANDEHRSINLLTRRNKLQDFQLAVRKGLIQVENMVAAHRDLFKIDFVDCVPRYDAASARHVAEISSLTFDTLKELRDQYRNLALSSDKGHDAESIVSQDIAEGDFWLKDMQSKASHFKSDSDMKNAMRGSVAVEDRGKSRLDKPDSYQSRSSKSNRGTSNSSGPFVDSDRFGIDTQIREIRSSLTELIDDRKRGDSECTRNRSPTNRESPQTDRKSKHLEEKRPLALDSRVKEKYQDLLIKWRSEIA